MDQIASRARILCQPDGRKGCSACCGLFNFTDLTREQLARFLHDGAGRVEEYPEMSEDDHALIRGPVRDLTSHICPYQGFLRPGRPGCLLHPAVRGSDLRDRSFFKHRICGEFLCPAHTILSNHQKDALIEMVDDWYLYCVAVIDPESFVWILETSSAMSGDAGPDALKKLVESGLTIHARYAASQEGPVFFYTEAEYREYKRASLVHGNASMQEMEEIRSAAEEILGCR